MCSCMSFATWCGGRDDGEGANGAMVNMMLKVLVSAGDHIKLVIVTMLLVMCMMTTRMMVHCLDFQEQLQHMIQCVLSWFLVEKRSMRPTV